MTTERRGADDAIRNALDNLRAEIDQRVRNEQLSDQLTGLPNDGALRAALGNLLEHKKQFWIAFFEIDRFKWINDQFGYQTADVLLRRVADSLKASAQFFAGDVDAFRPHGDEFYLLGNWDPSVASDPTVLPGKLDLIRQTIAALQVRVDGGAVAQCTVSVGWLETETLQRHLDERNIVLTDREVLGALERTVSEAKFTRNVVTRFDAALDVDEALTLRSDCRACRCKFQVNLKRSSVQSDAEWWCPNCGTKQPRPPSPARGPVPQPPSI